MNRKYIGYILVAAVLAIYALQTYLGIPDKDAGVTPETPVVSVSRSHDESGGNLNWANPKTLRDHFERHGSDFKAADEDDYARKAHELYLNRDEYQLKTDKTGTIRIYDADTGSFGAYNADGKTRTFFKPSDGQKYFDRQPGE